MSETPRPHVRTVQPDDLELLWRWANDPATRRNSFSPREISLQSHSDWFHQTLASPRSRIYMLEIDGEPQGQVRYDKISSDEAEIDVSIAPEHRGQGMGTLALCLTRDLAINDLGVSRLVGIVMTSNLASSAAFRKAGFIEGDRRTVKGHECRIFVWPTS